MFANIKKVVFLNGFEFQTHRADCGLLVAELLSVSRHHVFDLQLLHDLLFLQIGVLLLSDGASKLLRVRLGQTVFQLGRQGIPVEPCGEGIVITILFNWYCSTGVILEDYKIECL